MNIEIIDSCQALRSVLIQRLSERNDSGVRIRISVGNDGDLFADVELDGRSNRFQVICKLRPSVRDVDALKAQTLHDGQHLLATVKASNSLIEHCKKRKISCLDLNGRIWLRSQGLLIEQQESYGPTQYRTADPPVNPFSLKGSRLARVLLSYPGRKWRQAELAEKTDLSQGLLSRLLNHACSEGWVTGSRENWTVADADSLLDTWAAADSWKKRAHVRQYSVLEGDPRKLAQRILDKSSGNIAFTQWFAAGLRFPYADVPLVSAYVKPAPLSSFAEALGAREVTTGGNLWLIAPEDAGVFQAAQTSEGYPLVCDAQIYLDLLQVGLRGPDQANALRKWGGFCKP